MRERSAVFTALAFICGIGLSLGMLTACGIGGQERSAAGNPSLAVALPAGDEPASAGSPPGTTSDPSPPPLQALSPDDPYGSEPEPLTVADCARCHTLHFSHLRENGGGHRIDCRECHRQFHAYNPVRQNFAELMPQCGQCHTNPHPEKHSACLSCHEQPHAPRQLPFSDPLLSSCGDCHGGPQSQLQENPSAHSKQDCRACHPDRHGRILSCLECHDLHYESQPVADCTGCHPVHKPLQTVFAPDDSAATCADCHEGVLQKLQATPSRHGRLNCTECHLTHRVVPECTECHSAPHQAGFLAKFPECLTCHLDAHDLPVK